MTTGRAFVSYLRVSRDKQGVRGLGIEGQREAVEKAIRGHAGGELLQEFVEVESGRRTDRPQLAAALALAKRMKATLIIAKLDRLARNAHFLLSVVEGCGANGVYFCDLPDVPPGPTGKFFVTMLAAVAELEAGMISQRTKTALAVAKARGTTLGATGKLRAVENKAKARAGLEAAMPTLLELQRTRMGMREMAVALMARGIPNITGGLAWSKSQVHRALAHLEAA